MRSPGPSPRSARIASSVSRALPQARPSGRSMAVSSATVGQPRSSPSAIIVRASSRLCSSLGRNAPLPRFTSRTSAFSPSASIMSKKLAEGLNALVLDVKRGSGAFLPKLEQSLELAQTMIALGEDRGCPTVVLLTAMDRPLGRACGNSLETEEAILALRGEGPEDLMEVTYALGVEMLLAAGIEKTSKQARKRLETALASGLAAEKFEQVIEAQGGNPQAVEDPSVLPQAQEVEVYNAPRTGVVTRVEPRLIGRAIVAMGGGRRKVEDPVDPTVGFVITVKPGDKVLAGEPIASVFAKDAGGIALGFAALGKAIGIDADLAERPLPLISHRVTKDGV